MPNPKRNYQKQESTNLRLKYLSSNNNSSMEEVISISFQKTMKSSKYISRMYLKNWRIQKEELKRIQRKQEHNINSSVESCTILKYNSKGSYKRISLIEKERRKILKNSIELSYKKQRAREIMSLSLRINSLKIQLRLSNLKLID